MGREWVLAGTLVAVVALTLGGATLVPGAIGLSLLLGRLNGTDGV